MVADDTFTSVAAAVRAALEPSATALRASGLRAAVRSRRVGGTVEVVALHVRPPDPAACRELTIEIAPSGGDWAVSGWVGSMHGSTHDEFPAKLVSRPEDVAGTAERFAEVAAPYLGVGG